MENEELAEKVEKYSAIHFLAEELEAKGIPFHFKLLPAQGGFQILYPKENSVVCSIIEHNFSRGHEENLLEIYGLNEKAERNFDDVIGNLTVEEVLEIIQKDYNNYYTKSDTMENKEEIKELSQTCEMMWSKDYRERFKAEFYQLKIRTEKLENFLAKIKAQYHSKGFEYKDAIEHDCDEDILEEQLENMKRYLFILKQRAVIENIDIF